LEAIIFLILRGESRAWETLAEAIACKVLWLRRLDFWLISGVVILVESPNEEILAFLSWNF
jgi:hypothetical protein